MDRLFLFAGLKVYIIFIGYCLDGLSMALGDSTCLYACQFLCKEYSVSWDGEGYKITSITKLKKCLH